MKNSMLLTLMLATLGLSACAGSMRMGGDTANTETKGSTGSQGYSGYTGAPSSTDNLEINDAAKDATRAQENRGATPGKGKTGTDGTMASPPK